MKKVISLNQQQRPVSAKGLAVHTNLRAGLVWDNLDDQALSWWNKVKGAVSDAANKVTDAVTDTTSTTT